jgi:non-specific serine/threonine protein kinase
MDESAAFAETTTDSLMELLMSPTVEEIREHLRCLRNVAEKGIDGSAAGAASVFRHQGDYWTIAYRGRTSRLRDSLGLRYLALLLEGCGKEMPALEILSTLRSVNGIARSAEEAPLLDGRAMKEYRSRLAALRCDVEEAEAANDLGRCEVLRSEIDAVGGQLCSAAGLGGRSRRFGSEAERARLSVTRAILRALARISSADSALGQHLERSVRTGFFCSYDPDPAARPEWELR